jgi:serine/threonine protein kinase
LSAIKSHPDASSHATAGAAPESAAAPEFALGLAGSVIQSRYRVNAVCSVNRDVVLYSAEDVRQGRSIVLKVLRDEFARDEEFVTAVRNQASALAAAAHVLRGVQRVYEFGVTDIGQVFVALEWVEGATLRDVLDAGGALDVPTALRVAVRVGEALEALHHTRLLHGQLGPDSVLMVNDGERIRLVGAELMAAYRTPVGLRLRDSFSLAYRAPEQIERGEATEATDVYALGMLLRQLLTAGRAGQTTSALAATPPLSPAIQRIITTAIEARPERRYPDVSVMVNDIWGATAVLPEPDSRPRSVKARGNPRRRMRRRRSPFTLRITAAVVTAGVIAAVVWVAGPDRIVSHFYGRVTPPPVRAVPVDRDVVLPPEAPPSVSESREQTPTPPASPVVTNKSIVEQPGPAAAGPLPAPVIVRQPPVAPPAPGSRPRPAPESLSPAESPGPIERRTPTERPATLERSDADAGDGTAAVDWLLKDRR